MRRLLAAFACLILYCFSARPASAIELRRTGHPRLTMTPTDVKALRADPAAVQAAAEAGRRMLAKSKTTSYTDCFATLPAPKFPDPHPYNPKWPYWTGIAREIRDYLEETARAWKIAGDKDCLEAARSTMLALTAWRQWTDPEYGEPPCLDTESLTWGMAAAYDLLYDDLSAAERDSVRRAIVEKGCEFIYQWGKKPGVFLAEPKLWPNGNAVVNTAMGVGGLALLQDVEGAEKYVEAALDKMGLFFREVAGADGGLVEGFGYGSYAVDTFTHLIAMAHDVCGLDVMKGDYLENAAAFPAYCVLPGGGAKPLPAIGDNGGPDGCEPTLIELVRAKARLKGDTAAAWYLYKAGKGGPAAAPAAWPIGRRFPSVEWAALRDGWGDDGALLVFKSGIATTHNHLDRNSFVLGWGSEWLLVDPGYQIYDIDYPPERKLSRAAVKNMHTYTAGTEGHSTLLVDGSGQNEKPGRISEFFSSRAFQGLVGDAAACYDKLSRFDRTVVHAPGRYILVHDDVAATEIVRVEVKLHASPTGEFLAEGRVPALDAAVATKSFLIRKSGARAAVDILAPPRPTLIRRQWPDSANYGHYMTFEAGRGAEVEDAFVLRPGPAAEAAGSLKAGFEKLAGRARLFKISGDRIVLNPGGGSLEAGGLVLSGRMAFAGEGKDPDRFGLVSGTLLSAGKTRLIEASAPISAGIVREGAGFTAEIEAGVRSTVALRCPARPAEILVNAWRIEAAGAYDAAEKVVRFEVEPGRHVIRVGD